MSNLSSAHGAPSGAQRNPRKIGARPFPCIVLLMICVDSLFALDRSFSAFQYVHTSWTQEEGGALPAIENMAQTSDGYLWLGTSNELIRFDGMRFVRWEAGSGEDLPSRSIRCLLSSSRGGLWIGTASGIARFDRGRLIRYPAADRTLGAVIAMVEDPSGSLWMLSVRDTNTSLAIMRQDGSVRTYGPADGLPDQRLATLHQDRAANLWIGTFGGLCRWSPGTPAACWSVPSRLIQSVIGGSSGELLAIDGARSVVRFRDGKFEPVVMGLENASLSPKVMMRDGDGNIWIGTTGQGLLRLRGGRVERLTRRDGLSSDNISALLEDREGNLWAGTERGIDQFSVPKSLHFSTLEGLSSDVAMSVCTTRQGTTWVGTAGGGLNRIEGERITQYQKNSGLPSTTVASLYADAGGRLWAGTTGGLAYLSGDRFVEMRAPGGASLDGVFAIAGDPSGTIWLADSKNRLLAIRNGVARALSIPGAENKRIYQLQVDRQGRVWAGFYQDGVVSLNGGSAKFYGMQHGLTGGPVQAIYEDRTGAMWVGTGAGLSRFRNGSWTAWTAQHGLPEGGVQAIVEDNRDGLWLATANGLLRLSMAELNQTPDGSPRHLTFAQYGRSDGLRLANTASMMGPRLARSEDGRLWICTEDGIAVVDPARIRSNPLPPPVVVEQILVDGRPVDINSASEIVFRGRELQIAYTGLSLMAPERVRFRYKLDGFDRTWTDAGTRRNVVYVNLPPGRYRFHVIACNNDGVWNTSGAGLAFRLAPYFYQTTWFAVSCAGALALLIWGFYRFRVRRLVSRFQLVAQERARVTRELHDSLLQGFSGVVYQLEAAARLFDSNPELSKERLERAINQADQSLGETRRTIMSMRLPALESHTLPEALSAIGAQLTKGKPITFHLTVKGLVRQLRYDVQANIYLIGREAITNAVNHAEARRILAQLMYSEREVRLTVEDDGSGFDPESAKEKKDHWGVAGMRERAKQIDAGFTLESARGRGTKIGVSVESRQP
jgi:ligand-binding sensor domain-containing protein/signal transduction histidine kinase